MGQSKANFARPQSIKRQHTIKGILYMIDRFGGSVISVEDQDEIIRSHLEQGTYEYEHKTGGRSVKYDVKKTRDLMTKLVLESKLVTREGEDKVTLLFRVQSQALRPAVLEICGYKPSDAAASTTSLVFGSSTTTPDRKVECSVETSSALEPDDLTPERKKELYDYRAFSLVLRDIDDSRSERNDLNYKYSSCAKRIAALQDICGQYNLNASDGADKPRKLNGDALDKIVYNVFRRLKPHKWVKLDSLWREGSDCLEPCQLQKLNNSCTFFDQEPNPSLHDGGSISDTDSAASDIALRPNVGTRRLSTQSLSLSSRDIAVASTQPLGFSKTVSIQSTTDTGNPRKLKRKSSAMHNPNSSGPVRDNSIVRSPEVLVPQHEGFDSAKQLGEQIQAVAKPQPSKQERLTPSDAIQELQSIYNIERTQVLWMIGHLKFTRCSCPVTPDPDRGLLLLYQRCWGDEWRQNSDTLLADGKRSVADDATALLSAFLFDNILTGAAPPGECAADGSTYDDDFTIATPGSRHAVLPSQLFHMHTQSITTQFFAALNPYFMGLSQLHRMMYSEPFAGDLDPTSSPHFRKALSEVAVKALTLRLRLETSGLQQTFFWPKKGEPYDDERMQAPVAPNPRTSLTYVVAFTTFPGLTYVETTTRVAYRAWVVLQIATER